MENLSARVRSFAAVCSIISFIIAIYTSLADKPLWQSYFLFGISILGFIFLFVGRKQTITGAQIKGKVRILKGIQPLPWPEDRFDIEVFYPTPFKHTPNLTIKFPRGRDRTLGGRAGIGHVGPPSYEIIEQRPDGFKLKVLVLSRFHKRMFEWQAEGVPIV